MIGCRFESGRDASLRHVVVDNLVLNGNLILLVKRSEKLSLEGGKWGLPGGFVERDETVKEAAAREILEETGYKVGELTLLRIKDSPQRPHEDRQNIAFVHFCTAQEKIQEGDWESSEVKWFPISELPPEKELSFDHLSDIRFYQDSLVQKN